jgi:hypothetical protein
MRRSLFVLFAAMLAAVTAARASESQEQTTPEPTPEEKMARRFPQPVRVGFLIGLPVIDERSAAIGHVRDVVRTPEGKLRLVMPYGGVFGIGARAIAIPIEAVAMLGAQVAAVDMPRAALELAPTWYGAGDQPLGRDEVIRVGLTRR